MRVSILSLARYNDETPTSTNDDDMKVAFCHVAIQERSDGQTKNIDGIWHEAVAGSYVIFSPGLSQRRKATGHKQASRFCTPRGPTPAHFRFASRRTHGSILVCVSSSKPFLSLEARGRVAYGVVGKAYLSILRTHVANHCASIATDGHCPGE